MIHTLARVLLIIYQLQQNKTRQIDDFQPSIKNRCKYLLYIWCPNELQFKRQRIPSPNYKKSFISWSCGRITVVCQVQQKCIRKNIHILDANSTREYLDCIGLTDREEGELGPVYGLQQLHFSREYKGMYVDLKKTC